MMQDQSGRSVKVVSQSVNVSGDQVSHLGTVSVPVCEVEGIVVHRQPKHMVHHTRQEWHLRPITSCNIQVMWSLHYISFIAS